MKQEHLRPRHRDRLGAPLPLLLPNRPSLNEILQECRYASDCNELGPFLLGTNISASLPDSDSTGLENLKPHPVKGANSTQKEDQVIAQAIGILNLRLRKLDVLTSPESVKDYLRLQAEGLQHEIFSVLYLDSQNRLIEYEQMFRGTLTQTSVYPREVVIQALKRHAAAVIFHHNHPSGLCTPSRTDEALTATLKSALALVDVRVLDHIITCDTEALSMAERGLL